MLLSTDQSTLTWVHIPIRTLNVMVSRNLTRFRIFSGYFVISGRACILPHTYLVITI